MISINVVNTHKNNFWIDEVVTPSWFDTFFHMPSEYSGEPAVIGMLSGTSQETSTDGSTPQSQEDDQEDDDSDSSSIVGEPFYKRIYFKSIKTRTSVPLVFHNGYNYLQKAILLPHCSLRKSSPRLFICVILNLILDVLYKTHIWIYFYFS